MKSFVSASSEKTWPSGTALVVVEHVGDGTFNRGACCMAGVYAASGAETVVVHDVHLQPTEWSRYTVAFKNVLRDLRTKAPYFHYARYASPFILGGAVAFHRASLLWCGGYAFGDDDGELLYRLRIAYDAQITDWKSSPWTGPMHYDQFSYTTMRNTRLATLPPKTTAKQEAKWTHTGPLWHENPSSYDCQDGWNNVYGLQCFFEYDDDSGDDAEDDPRYASRLNP